MPPPPWQSIPPPGYGFVNESSFDPPPPSIFAEKLNIPDISSDILLWDQTWEQILPTLSASQDVYPILSPSWLPNQPGALDLPRRLHRLHSKVSQVQLTIGIIWDKISTTNHHPIIEWLRLSETQRMRHLLNGLQLVCQYSSRGQDARAMCPEITTTALLQDEGKAYMHFLRAYAEGIHAAGRDNLYLLPNEWWDGAVEMPHPWPEDINVALTQLTVQRNEFIGEH